MDFSGEIVLRNLDTMSDFEVVGISSFSRHGVSDDTWWN